MRPSHHLCSLVPSIPCSSATISDRPSHDSSSASLSHKRSKSPAASVPLSSPISGALSYARANLLPSPKRIRSPESATVLEVSSVEGSESSRYMGTELEMDDDVVRSDGIDIDPKIQVEIDECIAYADALRDRGIDARVVVEAVDQEKIEIGARGPNEVRVDRVTHLVIARDIPKTMPNTRSGASMTREGINEQINSRLARALGARDAGRNLEPLIGGGGKHEEISGNGGNANGVSRNGGNGNRGNRNGGNGNRGANGNGNGNGGGNGYNPGGFVHVARECTYQDFLKFQPLSFNGMEGVVGLTHWFKKMEKVFHISNCPEKYQVKMVPNEEGKVKRFVGGLLDNIQGNVITAEPAKLQDAIRIANNLMDQKLKGYARSAENKRRLENNPRDNRGQQLVFKLQNVGDQNVARANTTGNNEKKGYI
ncbi:hypothetical protein Tco_0590496, partial [Tanacetum coccineum]